MADIPEGVKNKQVTCIIIIFVSENSSKDATEFCDLFNKTMHGYTNCKIIASGKDHLAAINFNKPVYESKLRKVIEDLMVKMNIKDSEIEIAGWLTA